LLLSLLNSAVITVVVAVEEVFSIVRQKGSLKVDSLRLIKAEIVLQNLMAFE